MNFMVRPFFFFFLTENSCNTLPFGFQDDAHAARRKYKKDLDLLQPNLEAYTRQKALATGSVLATSHASGSSEIQASCCVINCDF